MNDWIPDTSLFQGPIYLRIADAIQDAVERGRLAPGERLPTQRAMSERLGVTLGTVSRGYLLAEKRGVISGQVGRGSFVRADLFRDTTSAVRATTDQLLIDMSINVPPVSLASGLEESLKSWMHTFADAPDLTEALAYQPHAGRKRHRQVACRWIARTGWTPDMDQILITSGTLHGIFCCLTALMNPGDVVLTEPMVDPGIRDLLALLKLRPIGVEMDEEGVLPHSLERETRRTGAKVVLLTPTLHNPTGITTSRARREAVADIIRRCDLMLLEDDAYAMVPHPHGGPKGRDLPISAWIPGRSVYITSFAKCLAPGLRVGFAAVPSSLVDRLQSAIRATIWMAPPLEAELVCSWIEDGTAALMLTHIREEIRIRREIAAAGMQMLCLKPDAYHVWLKLPPIWRAQDFVDQARGRGVLVTSPKAFVIDNELPPYVRLCLGAPKSRDFLREGLSILLSLLNEKN